MDALKYAIKLYEFLGEAERLNYKNRGKIISGRLEDISRKVLKFDENCGNK